MQNYTIEELDHEEWRKVCTENNIEVSNLGRARNSRTGRHYSLNAKIAGAHHNGRGGYIQLTTKSSISTDGKRHIVKAYLHHLVAEAFLGPRPKGMEINHKDCNKSNNRVSNLEYCTPSENRAHAWAQGIKMGKTATNKRR